MLLVDPELFRESVESYAGSDQVVGTALLGYRLNYSSRLTIEDAIVRAPVTSNTFAIQFPIGY